MHNVRSLPFLLPLVLAAALGAGTTVPTPAAGSTSAGPTITVAPSTGLAGGDTVVVEAAGLSPEVPVRIVQCHDFFFDPDYDCADVATVTSDAAGRLTAAVPLADPVYRSRPFGVDAPVYCRADICRIFLSWTDASGNAQVLASDPLEFTGSPATIEASPTTDLRRVQRVQVHGTAFGAEGRTVTVVEEVCHDIVQDTGCAGAVVLRSGTVRGDGTYAFAVKVRRFLPASTDLGERFDCAIDDGYFVFQCQLTAHVLDAAGQPDESFGASRFGQPGVPLAFLH